jgi:hypothetical protein
MRVVRAFAMYLPSVACRHPYESRSAAQAEATSERGARAALGPAGYTQGVKRLSDKAGELANRVCVFLGEVGVVLLVGELEHAVTPTVFPAHFGPSPDGFTR